MAGLCIGTTTHNSIQVYLSLDKGWTDANGDRDYKWFRGKADGGIPTESSYTDCSKWMVLENGVSYGGYYTFKNLEPNTTYGFYCPIYKSGSDTLLGYAEGYAKTAEAPNWNLKALNIGEMDLTSNDYWDGYYEFGERAMVRCQFTVAENGYVALYTLGSTDTVGYFGTSPDFDIYGTSNEPSSYDYHNDDKWDTNFYIEAPVTAGTTYYMWVRAINSTTPLSTYLQIELHPPKPSIAKWDWYSSNGDNASASVTLNSYYALSKGEPTSDFSHLVWNDMVDKVMRIIEASGSMWWSKYASYYDTKMHSEPYELTADKFNSLRYNIGARYSTGIDEVSPGDCVYADYFITLTNCMNDWIDTL